MPLPQSAYVSVPAQDSKALWIDHFTLPTTDLARSAEFYNKVMGSRTDPDPEQKRRGRQFQYVSCIRFGLFVQKDPLPPREPLGEGFPRHAFFVRPEDVTAHLRRLDECGVEHTGAVRSAAFGESGTSIVWYGLEGHQHEYWAPDQMPEGAMADAGPLQIGRISHGVFIARDLKRTARLFERYCGLKPLTGGEIAADTLVLPLGRGGRLVFRQGATPSARTAGAGVYRDVHTALAVPEAEFWAYHERMWDEVPEWGYDMGEQPYQGNAALLPARTALHGSPAGRSWLKRFGRGDDWIDWDCNLFHFVGAEYPAGQNGALYTVHFIDEYMEDYLATHGRGPERGVV